MYMYKNIYMYKMTALYYDSGSLAPNIRLSDINGFYCWSWIQYIDIIIVIKGAEEQIFYIYFLQ